MNTLIGGLLVVSLLTRPSICKSEKIAYELLKPTSQIVLVSKEAEEDGSTSINNTLKEISDNARDIKFLFKERRKLVEKIHIRMDVLAIARMQLTSEQMDSFKDFHCYHEENSLKLQEAVELCDNKHELDKVKREVLKRDSDISFIHATLKKIINYQLEAIYILREMIMMATNTLATI